MQVGRSVDGRRSGMHACMHSWHSTSHTLECVRNDQQGLTYIRHTFHLPSFLPFRPTAREQEIHNTAFPGALSCRIVLESTLHTPLTLLL
jgi:hypothetical protein